MISRVLILALLALPLVPSAMAQQPPAKKKAPTPATKADAPKAIGKFDDWIAATHQEAGQVTCYAFTRAQSSIPTISGRGGVVLTVTQRTSRRDTVAIEAGFAFAPNATMNVQADQAGLDFYTAQRAAFARDNRATVTAFQTAGRAIARSPGPRDIKVVDTFSLKGFSAAYAAISKACPPK